MNYSEQTLEQLDYIFSELAKKYPSELEDKVMTDISFQAKPESGELIMMDDDDEEIASAVVGDWIEYMGENFHETVCTVLKQYIQDHKAALESLGILHPYSFVLLDEEKETVSEIYQIDDDSIVIDHQELMAGLDKDLDNFIENLMKF